MANEEGISALHNAACAGYMEVCRFLIERGADVNAVDNDGWFASFYYHSLTFNFYNYFLLHSYFILLFRG